MEQLLTVSMQQLACKLSGRHPVKQSASLSTTCPVCASLTYLLEEYVLTQEIIPQCILASAVTMKPSQSAVSVNTEDTDPGLSLADKNYHDDNLLCMDGSYLFHILSKCHQAMLLIADLAVA